MKLNKAIAVLKQAIPTRLGKLSDDPGLWVRAEKDRLIATDGGTVFVAVKVKGLGGHPDYILRKDLEVVQKIGITDTVRAAIAKVTPVVVDKIDAAESEALTMEGGLVATYSFNRSTLELIARAAARQDIRYFLNGVLFDGENVVATDGHRLHLLEVQPIDHKPEQPVVPGTKWIVPIETVDALLASGCAGLYFTFYRGPSGGYKVRCYSEDDEIDLTTKLVEGTYPDYHRVIRAQAKHDPRIDASAWREAVSHANEDGVIALKLAGLKNPRRIGAFGVLCDFHAGTAKHTAADKDGRAYLAPECKRKDRAIEPVSMEPNYLIDALEFAVECGEPTLSQPGNENPVTLHGMKGLAVVMPRRL